MGMVKSHFYEVAGLQFELRCDPELDTDMLLPSFTGFRKGSAGSEGSIAVVTLVESKIHEEEEVGILRSDISVVWGDNFRFYERENTFATHIKHQDRNREWLMESTRDFKESVIYGDANDPRTGELLSWLLMVVFGQVGSQHQRILIHASVIAHRGKQGVAFLGKSGTGKSTHSRLWLQSEEHTSELQSRENLVCRL